MFRKICSGMRMISTLTLVVTAIAIFSASYYIFGLRVEEDIRTDAYTVAEFLEHSDTNEPIFDELLNSRTVSVLGADGSVKFFSDNAGLFEGEAELLELSSIEKAVTEGFGDGERYATGILRKMYSASVRMSDDGIVTVSALTLDLTAVLAEIALVGIIVGVLIYILSAVISRKLTENIIAPIEKYSPDETDEIDFPYEELKPFIQRISNQNAEIKRQMERVKRQKLRLQAVSESMSEGLIVLDREGNILSVNDSAMSFLGTSGKEKYTKTGIMSLVHGNSFFADNILNALHNQRGSFRYDNAEKSYEVFYSPVNDDGRILGVVILMFDITEKLQNEQIRAEFTANVSHELKTPLTTIHGFAQLLSGGMAQKEDVSRFASKIEKESGRLITLVEDIIELSNLDEGAQAEKTVFSLYPMVCEIAEGLRINAAKRDIEISVSGDDFTFEGDSIRIHELLYNITDNAVKYNKDGGRVDIVLHNGVISITDTGIGIPDEYKSRIFERFFRVDKSHSKKVNGTGLGLSIVKHIAKNNGIVINLDSTVGKGSRFDIVFCEGE